MKISFSTKEESNQRRQEEFLALSGTERVFRFFELCRQMKQFPVKNEQEVKSNNFIITKAVK